MKASSRFDCPSVSLKLTVLLKRTRSILWIALALAIVVHFAWAQWRGTPQQARTIKPLTTQFVKRQPRLTKPLELKKRPRPRQRQVQRQMVSIKAKWSRGQASTALHSIQTLDGLARPRADVTRAVGFQTTRMEPMATAAMVEGTKEPANKVDMSLEMIDIEALDTGRYQALVIQDPTDKRNVRGYFHIAQAFIPSVANANASEKYGPKYHSPLVFPNALHRLSEQVNRYTDIRTDVSNMYAIGSARIFETPWLVVYTQASFALNSSEADILGRYLTEGGFVYAGDNMHNIKSAQSAALRTMFEDALLTKDQKGGRDWSFEKLPNDHPLYHCFFDFDGAPPGFDNWSITRGWQTFGVPYAVDYIEGITIDGRLIGILDCKAYLACWAWWNALEGLERFPSGVPDGTRQYQLGVNMIVFALTQEGSITNRVMDTVGH